MYKVVYFFPDTVYIQLTGRRQEVGVVAGSPLSNKWALYRHIYWQQLHTCLHYWYWSIQQPPHQVNLNIGMARLFRILDSLRPLQRHVATSSQPGSSGTIMDGMMLYHGMNSSAIPLSCNLSRFSVKIVVYRPVRFPSNWVPNSSVYLCLLMPGTCVQTT